MDLPFDPELDLEINRVIAASPATIWRCLTEAALIEQWFCPKPWQAHDVVMEPHPGGAFSTPMKGPDGAGFEGTPGCILAAEPERLLVFTDALGPGLRPGAEAGFMTGSYALAPVEAGTRLTARALHAAPEQRARHEEMGFYTGWGTAVDQLAALASTL